MPKIENWSKVSNPKNALEAWKNDSILESSEAAVYLDKSRPGESTKDYVVQYPETARVGSAPTNMSFHDSKSEARKAAVEWMKNHPHASYETRQGYYYSGWMSQSKEVAENTAEDRYPNHDTRVFRRDGGYAVFVRLQ